MPVAGNLNGHHYQTANFEIKIKLIAIYSHSGGLAEGSRLCTLYIYRSRTPRGVQEHLREQYRNLQTTYLIRTSLRYGIIPKALGEEYPQTKTATR